MNGNRDTEVVLSRESIQFSVSLYPSFLYSLPIGRVIVDGFVEWWISKPVAQVIRTAFTMAVK